MELIESGKEHLKRFEAKLGEASTPGDKKKYENLVYRMTRTLARKADVEHCHARITKKIQDAPNDHRVPAWKARLSEYELSLKAINMTLDTGIYIQLKDVG